MAGIYFHYPFCRQACHYCNFHFSTQLSYQDKMLQAFEREIEMRVNEFPSKLESIYFGGGSPSLLSPKSVEYLINVVVKKYKFQENIEITLEIQAHVPEGIEDNIIRIVTENGRSLGFDTHGFEQE